MKGCENDNKTKRLSKEEIKQQLINTYKKETEKLNKSPRFLLPL